MLVIILFLVADHLYIFIFFFFLVEYLDHLACVGEIIFNIKLGQNDCLKTDLYKRQINALYGNLLPWRCIKLSLSMSPGHIVDSI